MLLLIKTHKIPLSLIFPRHTTGTWKDIKGKTLQCQIKLAKSAMRETFIYMSEFPRQCMYHPEGLRFMAILQINLSI